MIDYSESDSMMESWINQTRNLDLDMWWCRSAYPPTSSILFRLHVVLSHENQHNILMQILVLRLTEWMAIYVKRQEKNLVKDVGENISWSLIEGKVNSNFLSFWQQA